MRFLQRHHDIIRRGLVAIILGLHPGAGWSQWQPVPPVDFSGMSVAQFADHELEVPYHLRHFAQLANSVVESPITDSTGTLLPRGFPNIKVNREPQDNKPYNARIMELQLAFAYFYTANRPWNPYRGHPAVRDRLEAMLRRWTEMQAPPAHAFAGLFTEYSETNWSLAPTGFGVRHAAEALDLLRDSGLPFDSVLIEDVRVSLRRALMAMFTRADMRAAARVYSNQFSGSYHAALLYLENWPDSELESAFLAAFALASSQDQSPAGFWYEQGGPDTGYSGVHDNNMRIALPRLRARADLLAAATADENEWNQWLCAMLVPQPFSPQRVFFPAAGLQTRTSESIRSPQSRPYSEFAPASRVFSLSETEYAAAMIARRNQVQSEFGNWAPLAVPSSSSYIPGFVHDAVRPLNVWHPTAKQREAAAIEHLACFAPGEHNRVLRDPLPMACATAKRPGYYAIATTGNIRVTRQCYGLGLLWNPIFGMAVQSVAGAPATNPWLFGTRRGGAAVTYETENLPGTVSVDGSTAGLVNGINDLADGEMRVSYPLAAGGTTYGQKSIAMAADRVRVEIAHPGAFTELLPLAHANDATLQITGGTLTLTRPNGSRFFIEVSTPGAVVSGGATSGPGSGLLRRPVTITSTDSLAYVLRFSHPNPSPPALRQPARATGLPGQPVDVDLRAFSGDAESGSDGLVFAAGPAVGGIAELLDDGRTVRFFPSAGFTGARSFSFSTRDRGFDARWLRYFRFEPPDDTAGGSATDASGHASPGQIVVAGSGDATREPEVPPGFPAAESYSLRLLETGAGAHANLRVNLPGSARDLSNEDWTVSLRCKRATTDTHDFLFYIGSGNGFSGDGHELEVFAPANSPSLRAQYWNGANVRLGELNTAPILPAQEWHHVALTWQAQGSNGQGTLTLYLDGLKSGEMSFAAAFKQNVPIVFGGIPAAAADPRNFNGWIDDIAIFAGALGEAEIASLSGMPAANLAGRSSAGEIRLIEDAQSAGLAARWDFEEGWDDVAGEGMAVVPSGAAALDSTLNKEGAISLGLPGPNDHVETSASVDSGSAFTMAAWIHLPAGADSIRTIAANSASGFNAPGFRFFVNRFNAANAELVLETGNGSQAAILVSPAGTVAANRWQHVAAAIDRGAGTAVLYLNGRPVATGACRVDFANNAPLAIGAMRGGQHGLRGNLDDFRRFERVLTAEEVRAVFDQANLPPVAVGPGDITLSAGETSPALPVEISDAEDPASMLVLTAESSDPDLLPVENIAFGGSGSSRTVHLTPVAWRAGTSTVTIRVSDGLRSATTAIVVTVTNGGSSARWVSTEAAGVRSWLALENWASSIPPYPGPGCDLEFLTGITGAGGIVVANQDMQAPFATNRLRLGGDGPVVFRVEGGGLSLVPRGSVPASLSLEAGASFTHDWRPPILASSGAQVSGDGAGVFIFGGPISGSGPWVKTGTSTLRLAGANQFTGSLQVQAGQVIAAANSALGSSGANTSVAGGPALATLAFDGGITTAEPIQLVMHNTPGHAQIRNLGGNNQITGNLLLNAGGARWSIHSAAGWLEFTGAVRNIANPSSPDAWRKLHLSGNAGGAFLGPMEDSPKSKLGVVVESGDWRLDGVAKSHTGLTEVLGGRLSVSTGLASRVVVGPSAILRGSGGETSSVLELRPGAMLELEPANWSSAPPAFAAASVIPAAIRIRFSGNFLANFTESPASFPILHVTGGLPVADWSATPIVVANFPGRGRWSIGTTATTLILNYRPDGYIVWQEARNWNGADSDMPADPDGDGLSNLLEYALAGNPLQPDPSILPRLLRDGGGIGITFTRIADPDLLYSVQASPDPAAPPESWQTFWSSTGSANLAGPVLIGIPAPSAAPARGFYRLKVERADAIPP